MQVIQINQKTALFKTSCLMELIVTCIKFIYNAFKLLDYVVVRTGLVEPGFSKEVVMHKSNRICKIINLIVDLTRQAINTLAKLCMDCVLVFPIPGFNIFIFESIGIN